MLINLGNVYYSLKNYEKALEYCARHFAVVLEKAREKTKLREVLDEYPHLSLSESWGV